MDYIIGIYADDYLLLLELMSKLDRELPNAKVIIYESEKLFKNLPSEATLPDTFVAPLLSQMGAQEADLVVLLDDMPGKDEFINNFDGSVIDASDKAYAGSEDVIYVEDPLISILYEIALVNEGLTMNIGFPLAVYGKDGVDTLMQGTRSLFSFECYEESILSSDIAFNMHFYKNLPHHKLEKAIKKLRSVSQVNVRLYPLSTVFVVDLYSADGIQFPSLEAELVELSQDVTVEDVNQDQKLGRITYSSNACTIMGDYLHLKTDVLFKSILKAVRGV